MDYLTWNRQKLISEIKSASFIMTMQVFTSEAETKENWKFYSDKDDAELNEKTTPQLKNIYFDIKKHDAEFKKQIQEHIEKNLIYNQESANADNEHWAKHPYWSIEEGITLIFGKDPRKVKWEEVKQHTHYSPFAKKFEEMHNLALRYIACGQLTASAMPGVFLAWAQRMGYEASSTLIQEVENVGNQIVDWQMLCKQTMEIVNQRNQKIDELEKVVQEQKKQLEIEAKELKESERQSVYRLLSTMAYDGYKYKLSDNKSPVPNEISNAVTEVTGESIDADTVRKWLRKAIEKYPLIKT